MVKILFVCHGSILKSLGKASKIKGFRTPEGVYYTTTTPVSLDVTKNHESRLNL